MTNNSVAIVGLGLIGSSLGLALHTIQHPPRVVGFDIDSQRLKHAQRAHAVDRACGQLREAVGEAELVVVATPVRAIPFVIREMLPALSPEAVVTDTGSTKAEVVKRVREMLPARVHFVGGHPLTGKLTASSGDVSASLFEGTLYCLTPLADTDPDALERVTRMVEAIGAQPYFLEPDEHDALLAGVSHLPYVLAVSLMRALAGDSGWPEMQVVAAGGFDAATQLAQGDPQIYADICLTNQKHILRCLDRLTEELGSLKEALSAGDETLLRRLAEAHAHRQRWLERRSEPPSIPSEELRRQGLLIPPRLGDMLRGKPDRS